jgi:chromosomal replication initiation ATPase DnaA
MPDGGSRALLDSPWTRTPPVTILKPRAPRRALTLRCIREIVCANSRTNWLEIMSDDSLPRIERTRSIIAWLAYCHAHDTPEIGAHLGRDPSTVSAMIYQLDREIEASPALADRVIGLAGMLEKARGR